MPEARRTGSAAATASAGSADTGPERRDTDSASGRAAGARGITRAGCVGLPTCTTPEQAGQGQQPAMEMRGRNQVRIRPAPPVRRRRPECDVERRNRIVRPGLRRCVGQRHGQNGQQGEDAERDQRPPAQRRLRPDSHSQIVEPASRSVRVAVGSPGESPDKIGTALTVEVTRSRHRQRCQHHHVTGVIMATTSIAASSTTTESRASRTHFSHGRSRSVPSRRHRQLRRPHRQRHRAQRGRSVLALRHRSRGLRHRVRARGPRSARR